MVDRRCFMFAMWTRGIWKREHTNKEFNIGVHGSTPRGPGLPKVLLKYQSLRVVQATNAPLEPGGRPAQSRGASCLVHRRHTPAGLIMLSMSTYRAWLVPIKVLREFGSLSQSFKAGATGPICSAINNVLTHLCDGLTFHAFTKPPEHRQRLR